MGLKRLPKPDSKKSGVFGAVVRKKRDFELAKSERDFAWRSSQMWLILICGKSTGDCYFRCFGMKMLNPYFN